MQASEPITEEAATDRLTALGNRTRLRLYKLLIQAGPDGLNVGELGTRLAVPPSTLAHHLSALTRAGLIRQDRRGREVTSRADYSAVNGLVMYLTDQCCVGFTGVTGKAAGPRATGNQT
ncbi:MAG TPA: metalloregulator ArsR/SmtB family transcription factor [Gammaproteobacteria bacterium]|jgi:DNA-binding transcriptional ArsR family regulator|nr:metalloregulator ArsR/SmtB family transcription factor [Gammaproteobacteria bacterium]